MNKMRRSLLVALLIALGMPALGLGQTVSRDDFPKPDQLWLRIAASGRVFWHVGPTNTRNLPRLLPSLPDQTQSTDYRLNMQELYELLLHLNSENDHLITLITPDPATDHRLVDSVFEVIDRISYHFDSLLAVGMEISTEDLPDEARYLYRYAFNEWLPTDRRLHMALPGMLGISSLPRLEVAEGDTFAAKLAAGHWKDHQENGLLWKRRYGKSNPRLRLPAAKPDSSGGR
jgi:hypothetical protein